MVSEKRTGAPAKPRPPPRTLNIRKFAEAREPELKALHSIISARVGLDFRSLRNLRRRTTSFSNCNPNPGRSSKKRKRDSSLEVEGGKKSCRRIRRSMEFKGNEELGFGCSGDGTKRLRTHRWYAKRFSMVKRWGFHLPQGLAGGGRGSRAVLKWMKHNALVHDASYYSVVQLEGPQKFIFTVLAMVMIPPPSISSAEPSQASIHGVSYGSAMLHHFETPTSRPIAPVTYMWRPSLAEGMSSRESDANLSSGENDCFNEYRQLWILIHPAAFDEGLNVLTSACQKLMDETGIFIKCFDLEGKFGRLDVMGCNALQVLQKILHAVSEPHNSHNGFELKACSKDGAIKSRISKAFALKHAEHIPSHSILSLVVSDPRDLPTKKNKDICEVLPTIQKDHEMEEVNPNSKEHIALSEVAMNEDIEALFLSWLKAEEKYASVSFSDSKELWGSYNARIEPPVEESLLCKEKHNRRLGYYCLDQRNSGGAKTEIGPARSCPILLLKNGSQGSSCLGWTIILPLSWIKAFWIALISHGARAIGLRERHWIAGDVGLPSFPYDFPDCGSYARYMAEEAEAREERDSRRPPSKRAPRVPIPPPWDCISAQFEERETERTTMAKKHSEEFYRESSKATNSGSCASVSLVSGPLLESETERSFVIQTHTEETITCNSSEAASSGLCESVLTEEVSSCIQDVTARTPGMLAEHLKRNEGGHLLLYPNSFMSKRGYLDMMGRGKLGWRLKGVSDVVKKCKPFFLRVLLHAHKEGAFEDGAVVCAPTLTDLTLWTPRSYEEGGFQIPSKSLISYFTEQLSGKWELQVPQDPEARVSHRWPIGFVTTAFVRGSRRMVAMGFCEGVALARLREEQWKEMVEKGRSEVMVLVRNLRSSAYRPGYATIVLEHQNDDLEFM
ncbi:hypothetical protein AMTRI_Chr02g263670 [Amborella trichopoda]